MSVLLARQTAWDVYQTVGLNQSAEWNVAEASAPLACPDDGRDSPFLQVASEHMIAEATRVFWELRPNFLAHPPYTFQLQVGQSGNPLAEDWTDVGPPLVNAYMAVDSQRRDLGKQLTTHYRVILTDYSGTSWVSLPSTVLGRLNFRDWTIARELFRQESLRLKGFAGIRGFLLKRKRDGTPCTNCLDPETNMVTDSKCKVCQGTRFVGGYFKALSCQFVDLNNYQGSERRQLKGPTGQTLPLTLRGRFLGTPMLSTNDVWVDAESDLRYWVETVGVAGRVRGVPIALDVALLQFAFDNIIYSIGLGGS